MYLPKKNAQKGQILIIFLLVLVVGVAIVLSLASRSLTEVRTTTTSDESNKAYFAAEAGVESALKRISGSTGSEKTFSLDFTEVNQTTAEVSANKFESGTGLYAFPSNVAKDDVVQVSLLTDFNNLASAGYAGSGELEIYWGSPGGPTTALEVSLVYINSGGNFDISKWAIDPDTARGNNFCSLNTVTNPGNYPLPAANLDSITKTYGYKATINLQTGAYLGGGAGNCANSIANFTKTVLLRIRPLYNVDAEQIGVKPVGTSLPSQGFVIESAGSTLSGVTRKLRVIQPYPALPAIFDYVLFNGSSNPLQK